MDTKVCRVCVSVCVWEREKRQHFLALGHNDLASSVLYEPSSNPDCIFNADLLCFPGKRSPVMGPKGLRKKWEAGSEASSGGSGGMLCVLVVPPGNINTTVAGLALSPPGSPISILPSVSKSCLWPSTPSLWVFSFLKVLLGEISRNYLIEGRNLISNKQGWIDNRYHLPSLANKPGSSHILTNPFGWVFIDFSTNDETAVQRVWVCYSVWHSS